MDTSTLVKGASMFLTGATLGTALTFGTINTFDNSDLTTLEQHVSEYQDVANGVVDELEQDWGVQIESANAKIEDYQQALAQANSNIVELKEKATKLNDSWTKISNSQKATISQLQKDVSDLEKDNEDLEQDNKDLEQDNKDLDTNYNEELERLKQQQKQTDEENQAKIDALINQANAEIKKAEDEIKKLKGDIVANIEDDELTNYNRPQFDLDDDTEIKVEDAELSINMPSIDDEVTPPTTGGESGESGTEQGGQPTLGTVAYLEVELYNVLGNQIVVEYGGSSYVPVYNLNGTNKFRIEVPLSDVTNSSAETLYISYCDKDLNSIESNLVISGSVNSFVGEYSNLNVSGLSETGVQSLKVVVE